MNTLALFAESLRAVPTATAWYLAELGEAKGKQELFTSHSPQRLKALREHALIESAISSNRIEGVEISADRVRAVVLGKPALRDRNEEEVRGYRQALKLIHEMGRKLSVSDETILQLHRLSRGEIWDAGKYKEKDIDIIERRTDGTSTIRFRSLSAKKTPSAMAELVTRFADMSKDRAPHPLIALAAFNLDFLCIHPFRDGNGRVSRLLLLLTLYHAGFEVGRYISFERIIEQNKDRYYETLQQSSQGWHEGKHDPWPYINYLLYIVKTACKEFEQRFEQTKSPRGEKSELVIAAIHQQEAEFTVSDLRRACPGVSIDMIRHVLTELKSRNEVECLGRGRHARWKRTVVK
jgi:Fic family protein